ncbi:MAG: copper chaperone PCu(A)C [bacterium]|nr:copper chaperone PCu(A)C [bacterium]
MRKLIGLLAVLTLLVGACGSSGDLVVEDAWARTSASMQEAGAVYMTINGGDEADRLIDVSVSSDVAMVAELHETAMAEGGDGMMSMQPVTAIDIPADGAAMLEPGGFHVMLMKLAEPLTSGSTVELTLTFENAGTVEVSAEVRED